MFLHSKRSIEELWYMNAKQIQNCMAAPVCWIFLRDDVTFATTKHSFTVTGCFKALAFISYYVWICQISCQNNQSKEESWKSFHLIEETYGEHALTLQTDAAKTNLGDSEVGILMLVTKNVLVNQKNSKMMYWKHYWGKTQPKQKKKHNHSCYENDSKRRQMVTTWGDWNNQYWKSFNGLLFLSLQNTKDGEFCIKFWLTIKKMYGKMIKELLLMNKLLFVVCFGGLGI